MCGFSKEQRVRAAFADGLASRAPIGSRHVGVVRSRGHGQWGRGAGRAASAAGARARRGSAPGAAAVAVTSREGVGAAREPPDYKGTRPAAAGVAWRRVSAVSSACACSFSSTSSSSSSSGCRCHCGRVCSTTFQESSETRLWGGRVARSCHLRSRGGAPRVRGRRGFSVAAPATSAAAAAAPVPGCGQTQAAVAAAKGSLPAACAFAWVPARPPPPHVRGRSWSAHSVVSQKFL